MLAFFRKYQKIFFVFTTVIIVVSFAFFGSYQAFMPSRGGGKQTAFKSVSGKKVSQREVDNLCHFLTVEGQGGIGNIFNDGVVEKDFLQSGLATTLALRFQETFASDFASRFEREKRFSPYQHEKRSNLSARNMWAQFAPTINEKLAVIKEAQDPFSPQAFEAKCALYLAQRSFPPFLLQRMLAMTLKEHGVEADTKLRRGDLSLFGYRHLTDWFGPRFVSAMAQVVLNGAALAEERGYKVQRDEVFADLLYRTSQAYKKMQGQFGQRVTSAQDLYQQCLNYMGMTDQELAAVWEKVLLFRRLLEDVGSATVMDVYGMQKCSRFANEGATIEVTSLPAPFRFSSYEQLQQFEFYLEGVSDHSIGSATLPLKYLPSEQIASKENGLAVRYADCSIATVSKKELAGKVSVKQTWEWEVEEGHFNQLKAKFFELAVEKVSSPEERFALLQSLPHGQRALIDAYARELIVSEHPEWISEALLSATPREKRLTLGSQKSELSGIEDPQALFALLVNDPEQQLSCYSQDDQIYHSVRVNHLSDWNRLSFEEALASGVLEELVHKRLHASWLTLREKVEAFKNSDGTTKRFYEVKNAVADTLLAPMLQKLHRELVSRGLIEKQIPLSELGQTLASYRFVPFLTEHLDESSCCDMEWALQHEEKWTSRAYPELISLKEALKLEQETIPSVRFNPDQGVFVAQLVEHKFDTTLPLDKLSQLHRLLASEAKEHLFAKLLQEMEQKRAYTFSK